MTTYSVGDTVKIGELVTDVLHAYSKGKQIYLRSLGWFTTEQLDLMGAVIVPKPIEWQDGDVIAQYSQSFPSSLVDISYRVGGKWYPSQPLHSQSDAHASERVNKYDWKRVKVVPYDD